MQNILKIHKHPARKNWENLLKRPDRNRPEVEQAAREILEEVRQTGDEALRRLTLRFSGVELDELLVTEAEFEVAKDLVPQALRQAIDTAKKGIEKFHAAQQEPAKVIDTHVGVRCWRKSTPIKKVGLYIPSDESPAITAVLMLGIPAKIAGCSEIILCTSPDAQGKVHPSILYAAQLVGITKIAKIGGAQAIAAMAYGTESIPAVYKIFGSGNAYVMAAKHLASKAGLAIDMPAGPPELLLIADETATPKFVAADILAEAEQSPDVHVQLICFEREFAQAVNAQLAELLGQIPRAEVAKQALAQAQAFVLKNREDALDMVHIYGPEHLVLNIKNPSAFAQEVELAGTVCLGNYTSSAMSRYATGTNHALPSAGFTKAYGSLSVEDFAKKISFQQIVPQGLELLAPTICELARAEDSHASSLAVELRIKALQGLDDDSNAGKSSL